MTHSVPTRRSAYLQQGSIDSRSFRPTYDDNQALAELGFIVIAVDGMGTPLRSKSFQDVSYANMADNTLPDQVAALKQLGAKYPWIDLDRIGIWGHSGGGNRSEEHTSELQSLMRISYAVFCLKKKKQQRNNNKKNQTN